MDVFQESFFLNIAIEQETIDIIIRLDFPQVVEEKENVFHPDVVRTLVILLDIP